MINEDISFHLMSLLFTKRLRFILASFHFRLGHYSFECCEVDVRIQNTDVNLFIACLSNQRYIHTWSSMRNILKENHLMSTCQLKLNCHQCFSWCFTYLDQMLLGGGVLHLVIGQNWSFYSEYSRSRSHLSCISIQTTFEDHFVPQHLQRGPPARIHLIQLCHHLHNPQHRHSSHDPHHLHDPPHLLLILLMILLMILMILLMILLISSSSFSRSSWSSLCFLWSSCSLSSSSKLTSASSRIAGCLAVPFS